MNVTPLPLPGVKYRSANGELPGFYVKLGRFELMVAHTVAGQMYAYDLDAGARSVLDGGPNCDFALASQVRGTQAEIAVAKATNTFWTGNVGDFHHADIDDQIEVRGSVGVHYGLRMEKKDPKDRLYVQVDCSACPVFRLVGWLPGDEAHALAKDLPMRNRNGSWVKKIVDQALLRPIEDMATDRRFSRVLIVEDVAAGRLVPHAVALRH